MAKGPEVEALSNDSDIYRIANILIRDHGEDAVIQAAMRADEMLEQGDLDGLALWKRILAATEDLLTKERPEDASVH
jgi:hypothetical protein